MNELYYVASVGLFLATPVALLIVRIIKPSRMPWWLIVLLAAALGWVWSNLAVNFYYRHLDDLLAAAGGVEHAPQELVDRWQNDGAKLAFALLFGWLYGLLYLGPWVVAYSLFHAARRAAASRSAA